ncbi:DUF4234 domain-containing protein [Peribacillus alkalitolerans]|uniref:DUF4234 domain-containing protein n=1 Tax=Peribacillus alkalitolerans TaxID=1550385 RepID=UPI0013D13962|nr:DUF4234 domain-containing protein [Peribacillus alkalitolerans]
MEHRIELDEHLGFKKTNILFMVLASYLTFGMYVPYWFITRRKALQSLSSNVPLPLNGIVTVLGLSIVSLLALVFGPFILTEYGLELKDSLDYIVTMYGLGIVLYAAFRVREMLNDHWNEEIIRPVPVTLFHIWYLQFKINRVLAEKEKFSK